MNTMEAAAGPGLRPIYGNGNNANTPSLAQQQITSRKIPMEMERMVYSTNRLLELAIALESRLEPVMGNPMPQTASTATPKDPESPAPWAQFLQSQTAEISGVIDRLHGILERLQL
jgi:hypothetical protein